MMFAASVAAPLIRRHAALHPSLLRGSLFSTSNGGGSSTRAGVPWLLLSSLDNRETRYLYKLTKDEKSNRNSIELHRELSLPEIARCDFIGSSHGFLFTMPPRKITTIQAINPLTGDQLRPPPCDPIVYQEKGPKYEKIFEAFYDGAKAILSPSRDAVLLLFTFRRIRAQFARLDAPSSSWTPLPMRFIDDFIFHKGRLHAVNWKGDLTICDYDDPSTVTAVCSSDVNLDDKKDHIRSNLVESPDGDELYLLIRERDYHFCMDRTRSFRVFKLDYGDDDGGIGCCKWREVDNIGDLAMFVGPNRAVSLRAGDFSVLRSNSIYFTDDFPRRSGWKDTGVFDLEHDRFEFFDAVEYNGKKLEYPPPIWLENDAA